MGNKETGGVVLALIGFVFVVGAVKGTWRKAWNDLTGGSGGGSATVAPPGTQGPQTIPGASGGGSAGNQSSNLPGSGPAPHVPVGITGPAR